MPELVELGLELGLYHSNKMSFTLPKSGNENAAWPKEMTFGGRQMRVKKSHGPIKHQEY